MTDAEFTKFIEEQASLDSLSSESIDKEMEELRKKIDSASE